MKVTIQGILDKSYLFEIEPIEIDMFEIELFQRDLKNRLFGMFDSIGKRKFVVL